jgi:hypothetical protein
MTTKVTVKEEATEAIDGNLIYTHPFRESASASAEIAPLGKQRCI